MKNKNWYEFDNTFTKLINIDSKTITIWNHNSIKYQLLLWKDGNSFCFKFGKSYGFDSCWDNILPKF